jgi:hypothetical protein
VEEKAKGKTGTADGTVANRDALERKNTGRTF